MLLLKSGEVMYKVVSKKVIKSSINTKLLLSIFSTSLLICFLSCKNFLAGSDIQNKLEEEIKYANAESITVTVSPESMLYGHVTTGSPVTVKIGYPFVVNFAVDQAYNFTGWQAYSNFKSLAHKPLSSEYVEFSDDEGKGPGKSLKCSVTIKQKIDNLILIPVCASKPSVLLTEPLISEKNISMTTPIKITFNKKMDLQSILNTDSNGKIIGFKNFKVTYSKSDDEGGADLTGDITDYFDAEKTTLKKNGTQIVIPFKNKTDTSKWLPAASYIFVELGANIASDFTEGSAIMDNPYSWTFSTGSTGDIQGPVITSSSLAVKNQSQEKILETANFKDWQVYENNRFSSDYDSFKVSIEANDELTGESGILRYEVIQRLMYADKGAKLPNGTVLATATQFFNKNGEWNDILGFSKNDFEVTTEIDGDESGVENKVILLDELFTKYSTDGIYQITLTAVDALENYSEVPATYYFVRDTTAPCLKTNESNIAVSGGLLITQGTVNGLYAKTGKEEITFVPKTTIIDEGLFSVKGNSLQTASKTVDWKISFSTSSTEDTHSISSDYFNANSDTGLTLTISDLSTTQTYYPWFYFKDDLGNESAGECLSSQPVYVDATAPVVNLTCNSDNVVITEENNILILYSDSSQKVSISVSDSMSGISAKTLTVDSEADSWKNELTVNLDTPYAFTVTDYAGNSITKTLQVENKTSFGSPEIYNLTVYDTSEGNVESKSIKAYETSSYETWYNTDFYDISSYTNGDVTCEFFIVNKSRNYPNLNSIVSLNFADATIQSYEVVKAQYDSDNDSFSIIYDNSYQEVPITSSDSDWDTTSSLFTFDTKTEDYQSAYCRFNIKLDKNKFTEYIDHNIKIKVSNGINTILYISKKSLIPDYTGPVLTTGTINRTISRIGISGEKHYFKISLQEDGLYNIHDISPKNCIGSNFPSGIVSDQLKMLTTSWEQTTSKTVTKHEEICHLYSKINCSEEFRVPDETNSWYLYPDKIYQAEKDMNVPDNTEIIYYDQLGNETHATVYHTTDTKGPEINVIADVCDGDLDNGSAVYWYSNTENRVVVNIQDFDNDGNEGVGFKKACYYKNESTDKIFFSDNSIILPSDGTYTITAWDNFDNETSVTFTVSVDTTAPTCTFTAVAPYVEYSLYDKNNTKSSEINGLVDSDGNAAPWGYLITNKQYVKNSNLRNPDWCRDDISICFKVYEQGTGLAEDGITFVTQSEERVFTYTKDPSDTQTEFPLNGLKCSNRYFAFTDIGCDSHGLNIVVKDRLGNTTTTFVSPLNIDNTKPHFSSITSTNSTVRFQVHESNPNIYYVYTGSTNVSSINVSFTWKDNTGGIGLYVEGFLYSTNYNPMNNLTKFLNNSNSYTNGQTFTLSGTTLSTGKNYYFLAEDQMGNYNYLCLCVRTAVAPEGAAISVSISE